MKILQNHYMHRCSLAIFYNPPKIFEAFWKIIKSFLDPKASTKLIFINPKNKENAVELMSSYFDLENLPMEFGGKVKLQYDHGEYTKLMEQDELKFDIAGRSAEETVNGVNTNIHFKTEVIMENQPSPPLHALPANS